MIKTIFRSSSTARYIEVDFLNKECTVCYKNGSIYTYSNVSRRAMLNLLLNKTISLGFWINNNLLAFDSGCYAQKWAFSLPA